MPLLPSINSPADLKRLNLSQLSEVAAELRHYIIQTIANNGGHFGGPLGSVELCIALHYIFDSPRDKLVWDVGYQAYAHKILTGRRDQFSTLRQWGGVAPFPRVEESVHDTTNPGHGSTSISAALGYAVARDLQGEDFSVVAIIGDGSLVGGLALEGLHQAGHLGTRMIVLLNDNEMAISHNHSSMASYLRRLRTDPMYRHTRQHLEEVFKKLPGGELVIEAGQRIRAGVKSMVVPGMWFEELGYHYMGPINGHSLPDLVAAFKTARSIDGPVLVHAVTTKGKGFDKAEKKQIKYHAQSAGFLQSEPTAPAAPTPPTYTQVFADTLIELAEQDERIVAITAAMPGGTGLDKFIERFPDRGFDVGMTEEHAVTFASGLALAGLRPVVAIYSTFLQRAYDQIVHDVAQVKDGLPVTFAMDRGGLVGEDGATHQGVFDLSFMRTVPHLILMAPRDEVELRRMLATCLAHEGPAAIRYPRGNGRGLPLEGPAEPLAIGEGEMLRAEGDITIVAIGCSVYPALEAAELLLAEGHKVAVADARFIKPLDENLICKAARTSRLLFTVEENVLAGGFGSAVLELLARCGINTPLVSLGVPDAFVHHGSLAIQRRELGLDAEGIAAAVRRHLTSPAPHRAKNSRSSSRSRRAEAVAGSTLS